MEKLFRSCLVLIFAVLVWQCGGGQKLSDGGGSSNANIGSIQKLEKQVKKHPNDLELKKQLYKGYLGVEMVPRALKVMEHILTVDPGQAGVQFDYGEIQYQQGNYNEAYRAFLALMKSSSGEFYKDRVAAYITSGYLLVRITSGAEPEGFPVFSPDGKKIMYQQKRGNNWDIVEYDFETQTVNTLASTQADEELPTYSPDGSLIAYTCNADDHRPIDADYKMREIVRMTKEEGFVSVLTNSVADDWLPRFNHKGDRLLFVSERNDLRKVSYIEKQSDLFIMENDGAFQLQLTKTPATEGGPCFSADDKRIYFHSNQNGQYDIFSMKVDGSQILTIIDNEAGNDVNPYTSPDGNWITFVSDRDGNYEIYRARINGSEQERLTVNPDVDSSPVYSPDSQKIAFHSKRGGNYDIYVINLSVSQAEMSMSEITSLLIEMINN